MAPVRMSRNMRLLAQQGPRLLQQSRDLNAIIDSVRRTAERNAMASQLTLPAVTDHGSMDRTRFEAEIVPGGRPAVMRGLLADWPAVRASGSPTTFVAFLRGRATAEAGEMWVAEPSHQGSFTFTEELDGVTFERKMATIDQMLDLLLRLQDDPAPWSLYAGALRINRHLPDFERDHVMPLLDPSRDRLVSLWLGNRSKTAAHWDLPQNLACVVAGRRRFTLFPIEQVANLYIGPLDRTLAGQSSSLADLENPDFTRFPKLREAFDAAEVADLGPGDVLYMPSLWWHAVATDAPLGAMVNYWWRDGAADSATPLLAMLHAVMLMRDLPVGERERWRVLFDHYLFAANGDPAAHLPPTARGILSNPSQAELSSLRTRLARSL